MVSPPLPALYMDYLNLASPPDGLPQRSVCHPALLSAARLASRARPSTPGGGPCHHGSSLLCTASFSQGRHLPVFFMWLQWQSRVMGMGPQAGHCWPEEQDPLPDATPHSLSSLHLAAGCVWAPRSAAVFHVQPGARPRPPLQWATTVAPLTQSVTWTVPLAPTPLPGQPAGSPFCPFPTCWFLSRHWLWSLDLRSSASCLPRPGVQAHDDKNPVCWFARPLSSPS